jgi:hypothetical protein
MTASSAAKAHTKRPPPRAGAARRDARQHSTDAFVVTFLTIAGTLISVYDLLLVAVSMR